MGNDKDLDTCLPDGRNNGAKIVEQPNFRRHVFDSRPDLSAFGKKIVVGIHK